jgi:peptide/nickel transport system substrate-binding protein
MGGKIVYGITAETNGWNAATNQWAASGLQVARTMFDTLTAFDEFGTIHPYFAQSFDHNADFTEWMFTIRPGVKLHNGKTVTAETIVRNQNYLRRSPITQQVYATVDSIRAVGDNTVQFKLKEPWVGFPMLFATQVGIVADAEWLESNDSLHPIGTGAFILQDWKIGDKLTVKKNPNYWQSDLKGNRYPYLDSIEFRVITDDGTRSDALQSGDIDMMTTISAATANSLASKFQEIKDWDGGSVFVQLNTTPTVDGKANPLANIHARTAIAYATDPKAVASIAGKGLILATSPFGASTPWGMPSDQNGYLNYNVAKAKAEVTEYKKETGASSLDFTLMGLPNIDVARTLQQLSGMWSKAGITAHIQTLDQSARITATVTGNYQATFTNNYGFPDPDNDFYFWSSSSNKTPPTISINFSHYSTDKIDADLAAGRQSGYPNVRKQAYNDLAKQLNAGLTHIWLYYTPFTYIAEKRVQGFNTLQGPAHIPFGNFAPKTWWSQIWLSS